MKNLHPYCHPIALSFLFSLLFSTAVFAQLSWQETNSVKGYPISAFLSKENTLFSTTLGEGIYKTNRQGETWKIAIVTCQNSWSPL